MRILFAGTPDAAVPALEALLQSDHDVVAVLTRPDAQAGRGRTRHRSPVGQRADDAAIAVLTPTTLREPGIEQQLRDLHLDCAAIVAYGALIPPAALAIPKHGWINVHFSLLPRWRGAAPVQHAIAAADPEVGVSTFQLEAGLDTGPVFAQRALLLGPTDIAGAVLQRLAQVGAHTLVETLDAVADGSARPVAQQEEGITLAPKISVSDSEVDFTATATQIDHFIRSRTPNPCAWSVINGVRLKLGPVQITDEDARPPGVVRTSKREVTIGTADRPVRLGEIQPPGKRPMAAPDYARGARWGELERHG